MEHARLPSVNDAQLPETYETAKTALAECSSIDECKSWSDKAAALASYARQAKDDSMRKMAERIQARAIRRAGELLKQIEPAKNQHDASAREGDHPSRTAAAQAAGLSEHQQKQAVRVATVPESEFTEMVDSESPPTVTKLAEIGTKKQLVDLEGRDPREFNQAMHFVGMFEQYLRKTEGQEYEALVGILTQEERERLRSVIHKIDKFHDQVITRI